jgi:hypothetical protein
MLLTMVYISVKIIGTTETIENRFQEETESSLCQAKRRIIQF